MRAQTGHAAVRHLPVVLCVGAAMFGPEPPFGLTVTLRCAAIVKTGRSLAMQQIPDVTMAALTEWAVTHR